MCRLILPLIQLKGKKDDYQWDTRVQAVQTFTDTVMADMINTVENMDDYQDIKADIVRGLTDNNTDFLTINLDPQITAAIVKKNALMAAEGLSVTSTTPVEISEYAPNDMHNCDNLSPKNMSEGSHTRTVCLGADGNAGDLACNGEVKMKEIPLTKLQYDIGANNHESTPLSDKTEQETSHSLSDSLPPVEKKFPADSSCRTPAVIESMDSPPAERKKSPTNSPYNTLLVEEGREEGNLNPAQLFTPSKKSSPGKSPNRKRCSKDCGQRITKLENEKNQLDQKIQTLENHHLTLRNTIISKDETLVSQTKLLEDFGKKAEAQKKLISDQEILIHVHENIAVTYMDMIVNDGDDDNQITESNDNKIHAQLKEMYKVVKDLKEEVKVLQESAELEKSKYDELNGQYQTSLGELEKCQNEIKDDKEKLKSKAKEIQGLVKQVATSEGIRNTQEENIRTLNEALQL